MFIIKRVLVFLLAWTSITSYAVTSAKSSPPVVYTGITTLTQDDGTKIHLITRLHLIKSGSNPTGADNYKAILIHHLGDDGSNEYTTYNYAFTTIDPQTRRLVLSPAVNTEASPKLPQVELVFDPSLETAQGTIANEFISQRAGQIKLTNGWDYDRTVPVETRYGGIYKISCPEAPHAIMYQAKKIIISPNRFSPFVFANPELLDSDLHYAASIATSYGVPKDRAAVAGLLTGGRVKLQQRRLTMMEARNEWTCDRLDQNSLECRSTYHRTCQLQKIEEIHHSAESRTHIQVDKIKIADVPTPALMENVECKDWDRTFYGYLKHRLGGKMQPMKITMNTLNRLDENGKYVCDLQVTARLSFASRGILTLASTESDNGTMIYKFPVKTIDPKSQSIQLASSNPGEIILTIRRHITCGFAFDWVSKIFGFVGDVIVSNDPNDPELPTITKELALQGLSDQFQSERFNDQYLFLGMKTTPRVTSGFGSDSNPFSGVEVVGWVIHRNDRIVVEDSTRFAIKPDVFFDFYTNFFSFMNGNLLVGQVTSDGLTTRELRGIQFSAYDFNFVHHTWTRIQVDNKSGESILASLQPMVGTRKIGGDTFSPEKFHDLLFSSQDENIKRITVVANDAYYSTLDWGSIGGWKKVTSRSVTKDWVKRKTVTILVRYYDDRLIQSEIPIQLSPELTQ